MAAADVTLDQLADLVQSVKVAETGFGFLVMSNGNVIAVNSAGEQTLGVVTASGAAGQGVTGLDRSLKKSDQPAIVALTMPADKKPDIQHILLKQNGEEVPYIAVLKQLEPTHLWNNGPIVKETMTLGFLVPEREIYASLIAAQSDISDATNRILKYQIMTVLISLLVVFVAIFGISKRITAGLSALATAARRISDKDYTVRVNIPATDEVGQVGVAFNRMAEEIRYHTENLEGIVADRTCALGQANAEISALNDKLTNENLRLGAELDVARRIQLMVLPKDARTAAHPDARHRQLHHPGRRGRRRLLRRAAGRHEDQDRHRRRHRPWPGERRSDADGAIGRPRLAGKRRERPEAVPDRAEPCDLQEHRTHRLRQASVAGLCRLTKIERLTLSGQHEEVLVIRGDGEVERIDTMELGFPVGLEQDISEFVATRDIALHGR